MLTCHFPFPATLNNMDQMSPSPHLFVARDEELARMHGFIDQALIGKGSVALEYAKNPGICNRSLAADRLVAPKDALTLG